MNTFLIYSILALALYPTLCALTQCECNQIQSEFDCDSNYQKNCYWESNACQIQQSSQQVILAYDFYCDQFNSTTCPQTTGCAFWNGQCNFFTDCTPYARTTDYDCQRISKLCITDGQHCVQKTVCKNYSKHSTCVRDIMGNYCYWDLYYKNCNDAQTCDQLPTLLHSDTECRAAISTCTAKTGGGCQESGNNCRDQISSISCLSNKDGSQICYWNGEACVDKTCDNAPINFLTDETCNIYLNGCTTRLGGGCVTRSTCQAAQVQAACLKNKNGEMCYWSGTTCVDHICTNAPTTYQTNQACQTFRVGCITTGKGCKDNGPCSAATVEIACDKNSSGNPCIWDNFCKDKTCVNAPLSNYTQQQCESYMSICTINSSGVGCVNKTCDNASASLLSNDDCEKYLPNNDCVAKQGGGCVRNSSCATLGQIACVKDISGNLCFWDEINCKDKTCTNAPPIFTTHQQCQTFSTKCTVNSAGSGCVDQTCENSLTEDICNKDYNGNNCIFKQKCYKKQCAFASKTITNHSDCQNYLSSCTLSNTGFGCVPLPLICSAITIQQACYSKKTPNGIASCGWNGSQCIDYDCTTIDKSLFTTSACNTVLSGCVSANPINGYVQGCMALPNVCSSRLTLDNCEVVGPIVCLWNSNNNYCIQKTCMTASLTGTTGWLQTFTSTNCNQYLAGCISNNSEDGCMPSVSKCEILATNDNCEASNCFWNINSFSCVEKTCQNAPFITFAQCNTYLSSCTVNSTYTNCQNLGACNTYISAGQCQINANHVKCYWTGSFCRDQLCTDAPIQYQSAQSCENFQVQNGACTVISRVANQGCAMKKYNCEDYLEQLQCIFDMHNNKCIWQNDQCWSSLSQCSNIKLYTYNTVNCENQVYFCKANQQGQACQNKVCEDYYTQNGLASGIPVNSDFDCQQLDSKCILDSTIGDVRCQTKQQICALYSTQSKCTFATEGVCVWSGTNCVLSTASCSNFQGADDATCSAFRPFCNQTNPGAIQSTQCTSHVCADKTGAPGSLTNADCQAYDSTCVVNNDGSACVANNKVSCYIFQGDQDFICEQFRPFCKARVPGAMDSCITHSCQDLSDFAQALLTYEKCQAYDLSCSVNRDGTQCQTKQSQCSSYSLDNCTTSEQGECVGTSDSGFCKSVNYSIQCNEIYLGFGRYTHDLCQKKNSSCTNLGAIGCQAKTCANAPSSTSFSECNNWMSSCTWNGGSTCVSIANICSQQQSVACYRAREGDCVSQGTQCLKRTCDNAPLALNNHAACESFLSQCTIARTGGCIPRQSCSSYSTELQCSKNYSGQECYWSDLHNYCLDLICYNIDQSSNYDTHQKCNNKLNTCTVRSINGAVQQGCQNLSACQSYLIQEQCHMDALFQPCEWNTNFDIPQCVDKSCRTAPNSITTHQQCNNYYGMNSCTVAVFQTFDGINTLQGCIPVGPCSKYIDQEQCQINDIGGLCGWNGTVCADFACSTSPPYNNTDPLCQNYKYGCTVDQSGNGCMELLESCEMYQIEGNCIKNLTDSLCYWDSKTNKCITKTCENAPENVITSYDCEIYLSGCTSDDVKCKTKVCEDYKYGTDSQCRSALLMCTTDGKQCVQRGSCQQALSKLGCVTDDKGNQCEWIPATENFQAFCTRRTCLTAPIEQYTTESQCADYMANCTTKKNGGCVNKSICSAVTIDQACTKALDGTKCQWDKIANICRNKQCQDYLGLSHVACQAINSACTAGFDGHCANINSCQSTKVRAACIEGTDGPCLWITNSEGIGACYPYTSCQSLAWNTDSECKQISSNCTTDGIRCLGITLCSETNVNGGCVTGSDGNCIQTVPAVEATTKICKAFTSCTDAYYITHSECQTASYKCTTNGSKGCIPLASCSTYTKFGCYISAKGQVVQNGLIKSTGVCIWDIKLQSCRDQTCSDLIGATHSICLAQLSTCTSDGTNCLTQSTCSTYTRTACGVAEGTDGICIWQASTTTATTGTCRRMTCADVQNSANTTDCSVNLSGCISNGTTCIAKANCSTYTTQVACNSGGLDGTCVFTASTASGAAAGTGTCALMTSCSQASNDFNACFSAKDRCAYLLNNINNNSSIYSSRCQEYTCQSYQLYNINCNGFLNWDKTSYTMCQIKDSRCVEIDPNTLGQFECYLTTNFFYTWNAKDQKCVACQSSSSSEGNESVPTSLTWNRLKLTVINIFLFYFVI